jgi:hypothetical protein
MINGSWRCEMQSSFSENRRNQTRRALHHPSFLSNLFAMNVMLSRSVGVVLVLVASVALSSCGGGGSGDGPTQPAPNSVASVTITPSDSVLLKPGGIAQLSVAVRGSSGAILSGKAVTWSSGDNTKASVSPTGQLTAVALGRITITATSEGKTGSTVVVVATNLARDFAIVGAQFTQGIQDAAGSIPMILSGQPAVVNVLVQAAPPTSMQMQLLLRLMDASGAVVYTDTASTRGALGLSPTYIAPSAQFLVPTSKLAAGLKWQILRDPNGIAADDGTANDVYPATGGQALATASVPPLNIRFVPIVLAANGSSTPPLNDALIPDYLRTLRSIHPVGVINTRVGASFTTSASFGTPPTGGALSFWQQVLMDLDLARVADPTEATSNWFGVVAPPTGFNFTTFGGISYIPTNGTTSGPQTRTSVSVRTGWFSNPTQARDLVAHELGHTFGRQHAPCGAAGAPLDVNYPVPGGVLDIAGHDVYAWANGLATSAIVVPATTGDVMGYCFPVWASTYTYKAVLAFRAPIVLAARDDEAERTRVVVIRGSIDHGRTIKIEPVFTLNARPSHPDAADHYRVEGVDANGRVLFTSSFEPSVIDHAPTLEHFAVAVPVSQAVEDGLAEVRVVGPAGSAKLARALASPSALAVLRPSAVRRIGSSASMISCGDDSSRGILILDEATGEVRGAGSSASMAALVEPTRRLSVLCSDGLRTRRGSVIAP